jgi:hypothetical protein
LEAIARVNPSINLPSSENAATSNPISIYNSTIAIENCVLTDARVRLERDKISNSLRFKSLREITNFEDRWKESKDSTKKILKVNYIFIYYLLIKPNY